uniref:Uncharacterized protein n=1 Tax=Ralstonia solanacearum TaxID=305 RepID=A0A0S4WB04_RALSL|nr:protein of unknown function [Ralstonia solanacearum]
MQEPGLAPVHGAAASGRIHCQYAAVGVRAAGCHGAAAGGRCDGGAAGGEHGVLRLPHRSAGQGARDAGHRDGPRVPALAAKRHRAAVGRPDAQARRGKADAENRGQGVRTPAARSRLVDLPGAGASRRSGVLVRWHRHARPARTVDAAHATGNRRRARRIAGGASVFARAPVRWRHAEGAGNPVRIPWDARLTEDPAGTGARGTCGMAASPGAHKPCGAKANMGPAARGGRFGGRQCVPAAPRRPRLCG